MTFRIALRRWVASAVLAGMTVTSTGVLAQQLDWCAKLLQPALDAAPAVTDKKKPKSFSAVFTTFEQFSAMPSAELGWPAGCPTPPYGFRGSVTGVGSADRLGAMGINSENCATGAPPDGKMPAFLGADVALKTATGEVFHAKYCGIAVPQAPGSAQNTLSGLFVIVGMTQAGQRKPAIGYGTIAGYELLSYVPGTQMPYQGYATFTLDGVLGY